MFEQVVENNMMFRPDDSELMSDAIIKVIGVGGGGGNAVDRMSKSADLIKGVEFFDVNTDAQVLRKRATKNTIQIGANTTHGLGAGGDPEIGRLAAEEDRDALSRMLAGTHMAFIAVGMGGGSGSGASPVVASVAKEQGALTVAVVTKPFRFEGPRRMRFAENGIRELSQHVDSLIIIPNDKLRSLGKQTTVVDAFAAANDVLRNCVLGITNMIHSGGGPTGADINVDFADVKRVMSDKGHAMIGTGLAEGGAGEGRAEKAMNDAIASPLLENVDITGAKGMLISINAGTDFLIEEVYSMMDLIYGLATEEADIIFGCNYYPEMDGRVSVTLVATGIGEQMDQMPKVPPQQVDPRMINKWNNQPGGYAAPSQAPVTGGYQQQSGHHTGNTMQQGQVTHQQQSKSHQSFDDSKMWNPNQFPSFMNGK